MSDEQPYVKGELADLLKIESGLSDWEIKFLESISRTLDEGRYLSTGQVNKLAQIWDKHCK